MDYLSIINSNQDLIAIILLTAAVMAAMWAIRTEIRINKLTRGKQADSLENIIAKTLENTDALNRYTEEISKDLEKLKEKNRKNIQSVSTVRFNPFKDSGGNQSFASAFLDENGDGVVISTLYSRDRVGVYAKPIGKFGSEYELTNEEKQAIGEVSNKR